MSAERPPDTAGAPAGGPSRPPAFVTAPPRAVLFLCVHNSARSQMAEGFARSMAPAGVVVWSAGTEPARVHPLAIQVMQEAGIEITAQRSKSLDDVPWRDADTIVTLCGEAEESCPVVPGNIRRVHWPLPDPAAVHGPRALETFRAVRDEIRWRVSSLWPREA
jgi:arsenate reductase